MKTRQDLLVDIELRRGREAGVISCVVTVGIDRFARIRAAIGYDLAEDLVEALATRIRDFSSSAMVARLAPDALGAHILFPGGAEEARAFLSDMRLNLEQAVELHGHCVNVSARMGFSQMKQPGLSCTDLLHQAEMALDQAREQGAWLQPFSAHEYGDPLGRLSLLDELRDGLANGEVRLVYQPLARPRTGEVVAVEALTRWTSPTRGEVPPSAFIPTAEETGQIRDLTRFGLLRAVEDAKRLEAEGYPLRIAINVSGRLLTDRRFVETTMEILQQAPNRISFEITESAAIDDWKIALHHLKLFANAGVRISIDDYGAGVSSLAYVQQLPAQELKIDRSFISHLTHSHRDPLLVRSTIELGHALELEVVGEGVEDAETLALLSMMGCDLVQGYFIGYPMPLDELLEFLRSDELKERIRPPSAMHFGVAV